MSPPLTIKPVTLLDHEVDGPQNIHLDDKKQVEIDNILMPPPSSLPMSTNRIEHNYSSNARKRSRSNAIDLTYEIPNACGFTMDAFDFIEEDKENQKQKYHDISKTNSNYMDRNKAKRIRSYEPQVERKERRKEISAQNDNNLSIHKKSKRVSFLTDCNDCLIHEIFYIDYDHSKSQAIFDSDCNSNEIESLHNVKGTNDVISNELDDDDETLLEEDDYLETQKEQEKPLESNESYTITEDKNQAQEDNKGNKENESTPPNCTSKHNYLFSKTMTVSNKVTEEPKNRCDYIYDYREELDSELEIDHCDKEKESEQSTSEGHSHENKQNQTQAQPQAQQDQVKNEFCDAEDDSIAEIGIISQSELLYDKPSIQTRFADIIGHGHAKLRLDEMLLPLALPSSLAQSVLTGLRAAPASILLYGPPGTGKSLLAKAVAGEAQAAFMSIGPSDVLSKFVGESEQSIKLLFEEAKNKAKRMESQCTVLFFDEIDALGISRNGNCGGDTSGAIGNNVSFSGGGGEHSSRRILAELLIQLSNLSSYNSDEVDSILDAEENDFYNKNLSDGLDITIRDHEKLKLNDSEDEKTSLENDEKIGGLRVVTDNSILDRNKYPHIVSPPSTTQSPNRSQIISSKDELNRNNTPRIIVIAATNRPEDCDPALLRRFAIRVLIGLPTHRDRTRIMHRLLEDIEHNITTEQLKDLSKSMEGWSGSDLESVTREAVMAPVRECLRSAAINKMKARKQNITKNDKRLYNIDKSDERARNELLNSFKKLRPVSIQDFEEAISFWIGDGQGQISRQMAETFGSCHYDSDSTIEDNM